MSDLPSQTVLSQSSDEELEALRERAKGVLRARRHEERFVPVEPLQEGFRALCEREGIKPAEVAARLGWKTTVGGYEINDGRRVLVTLGLRPRHDTGKASVRVTRRTAARFADVLGLDPRDVGL